MKTTVVSLLWAISAILTADEFTRPALYDTNGEVAMKGSRAGQLFTEQSIRFNIGEFVYRRGFRKNADTIQFNNSCRIGFRNAGHAGAMTFSYPGSQGWPLSEGCWTALGDKNAAVAQMTVPVLQNGRRTGAYSIRMVQMPDFPEWVFIRLSFEGTPPGTFLWNFDGSWTEFDRKYSKNTSASRLIYFGGKSFSGQKDEPPALPSGVFSFGLYASNTRQLDRVSTILLARIPESCKASLSFRGNSQSVILRLTDLRKVKSESLCFALGTFKDSPGLENIEKFYASGRNGKIAGLLSSVEWNPIMNTNDLKPFSASEQTRLTGLFKSGKFDEYYRSVGVNRGKNEKEIKTELNSLLE